eukprot:296379-Pelagomonas_calceolata.AAC.3
MHRTKCTSLACDHTRISFFTSHLPQPVKRKPEAQQLVQSKCAVPALQPLGPDAASVAEHEAGVSRRGIIHAGLLVGTLLSAKASKAKEAEPGGK